MEPLEPAQLVLEFQAAMCSSSDSGVIVLNRGSQEEALLVLLGMSQDSAGVCWLLGVPLKSNGAGNWWLMVAPFGKREGATVESVPLAEVLLEMEPRIG